MAAQRVNLRHLYCLREVARRKSINAATEHVHLSQPAITQAIAKIESDIDAALFVRSNAGMFLTGDGELVLNRVERALDYIEVGGREALRLAQHGRERGFSNFHRLVTTSQLRALIAVVEAGSFSLAARQCGASQPSIHRRARDLEQLAGVTFLERSRSGVTATAAARALARYAKLAFAEIALAEEELKSMRGYDAGLLTIGAMPLARAYILPKTLTVFSQEYPQHNIRIVDGPYEQLLAGLRQGDIDVMLGAAREPPPTEDIIQKTIFDDPLSLIMRAGHPLARRKSCSVKDLARYPWIVPGAETPLRRRIDKLFAKKGTSPPTQLIECGSVVATRGLLLESDRLTLLSPHQVHYELAAGLLTALPHPLGKAARAIVATVRRDWAPTAAQSRFIALLKSKNFGAVSTKQRSNTRRN